MYKFFSKKIARLLGCKVSPVGIGLFRAIYGIVTLQEIIFLNYFSHLIFDPIPFVDVEFPTIPLFLSLWGIVAAFIIVGYRYQFAVFSNYIFWLVFVNFTSMQRDFDGGFDLFMIGAGFFLLFMPGDKAFSLDSLRRKLSSPFKHYSLYPSEKVSVLVYYLPLIICLGFLYFDSAVHKLFAEHWRNGLGSWLPATQPYYVSALDLSAILNNEWLVKSIGYTIFVFQFTFIFWFAKRHLQPIYLLVGMGLHLGITLTLNIYPFGMAMLAFYILLVPFSWWEALGGLLRAKEVRLTVFYDQLCPLCNRAVLVMNHFDVFRCVDFRAAQQYAQDYPELSGIASETLLTDLYALDGGGKVYSGLDTYIQILFGMRYMSVFGCILSLPGIYQLATRRYRSIADNRNRLSCTAECLPQAAPLKNDTLYCRLFEDYGVRHPKAFANKLTKICMVFLLLQLNSTLHYGIAYRLHIDTKQNAFTDALAKGSNAILGISQTFWGIAPHALYLHDHFAGYDRIIAITYVDGQGKEQWLPFVNEQGRLLAPNWGRVQSMWANIAVTPTINNVRLQKFIMKVTAFWGQKSGLNLDNAEFKIKLKRIDAPTYWVQDQLHKNLSGEWVTIGSATWANKVISFNLPDDINAL
ncbi:hypothetical protein JCM14076_20360 [Methylosoma difficile]